MTHLCRTLQAPTRCQALFLGYGSEQTDELTALSGVAYILTGSEDISNNEEVKKARRARDSQNKAPSHITWLTPFTSGLSPGSIFLKKPFLKLGLGVSLVFPAQHLSTCSMKSLLLYAPH